MLCNCINLNYIGIIKSFFLNHHLVLYILLVIDIITFEFFRSEDDFRKVESSSTFNSDMIQSNVFTAYYSQTNYHSPFCTSLIIMLSLQLPRTKSYRVGHEFLTDSKLI